ncbi:MAG: hypothetical protein ACRDJF_09345 [Actinomycetota bacterium]
MEQPPQVPPPENRAHEMERALVELGARLARIRLMVILGGAVLIVLILGALVAFVIFFRTNP